MERLGIVVAVDGTLEASNGLKLTGQGANQLGKELDALSSKTTATAQTQGTLTTATEKVGTTSQRAAQGVAQLGRELAQGDYAGAAMKVGTLAAETGVLTGGLALAAGAATIAVAAVGGLAYAAMMGAKEERALNDSLILTGNYAGLVAGQLDTMASSVARGIGGAVGDSREVLTGLTATGKFTTLSLQEVATAAQLMARFTGQSTDQVVKQFAGMANDVAGGAAKMNESYHFLSFAQYKHIELLEKQGRSQDAMRESSEAFSAHVGGSLVTNLGALQKAWQGVQNWASSAWNAMLGVGKTETTQQKIDSITERLNYLATQKNSKGWTSDQKAQAIAGMESERAILESDLRQERMLVQRRSEQQQRDAQAIADDRKKPRSGGRGAIDREPENERRLAAENAGLSGSFAADWDRLTEIYKKNGLTLEWLTEAQAKLLAKQPGIKAAHDAEAHALRELTQVRERNAQHMERDYANQEKELDGLMKTNEGLREQAEQVGKTKEQLGYMKAVRLDALIAQERENLIVAESNDAGERQLELMRRKISLLEQQREATQNLTAKTVEADAQKAQDDASKKFGDTIRQDLKNGLMRGFEAGKNPAQTLADTMGNMIKQRLVSAFADSILNSFKPLIDGVMANIKIPGMSGAAGGGGGGNDWVGSLFKMGMSAFGAGGLDASTGFFEGGVSGLGMGTFAKGGTFGDGISGHSNSVVSKPTMFAFAKGVGLMGEAGPEAVMPLRRGADGSLGVVAGGGGGGGGGVQVNIYNQTDAKVQTKQRKNSDGGMSTDVIISQVEDALADRMNAGTGSLYGAMGSRFDLNTAVR